MGNNGQTASFTDILDGRLGEYYGERRRPVVEASLRILTAAHGYLGGRDFGRLLDCAAEALAEPDRFRLGSEWFQARLEQGLHRRMDGGYSTVTRMAVRSLAIIESALADEFRVFLHLAAEAHRALPAQGRGGTPPGDVPPPGRTTAIPPPPAPRDPP